MYKYAKVMEFYKQKASSKSLNINL